MRQFGMKILAPLVRFSTNYATVLLKDIPPGDFAKMPSGIKTNHPAFLYGHLAIYPERILELVGQPELAKPEPKFVELFAAGKECMDDPSRTIYPSMDEIVTRFQARHQAILPILESATDDVFERANPNERMKDRFPTIGMAVNFLVSGHMMMHLGQVSTWRRCMGLGSAM